MTRLMVDEDSTERAEAGSEPASGASAALRDDPEKLAKLVGLVEGAH